MRYYFLLVVILSFSTSAFSQRLNSGTYIFKYCDLEYEKCVSTCKIVIKKDNIVVYATKDLARSITSTKEGDIIDRGIILRHKSGKWIIGKSRKDVNAPQIGVEGPAIVDFKKKEYWTF